MKACRQLKVYMSVTLLLLHISISISDSSQRTNSDDTIKSRSRRQLADLILPIYTSTGKLTRRPDIYSRFGKKRSHKSDMTKYGRLTDRLASLEEFDGDFFNV